MKEFFLRAHSDEQKEPSAPRLAGFLCLILFSTTLFIGFFASFFDQKLLSEYCVKTLSNLGMLTAGLYGASQLKSGAALLFQGRERPPANSETSLKTSDQQNVIIKTKGDI